MCKSGKQIPFPIVYNNSSVLITDGCHEYYNKPKFTSCKNKKTPAFMKHNSWNGLTGTLTATRVRGLCWWITFYRDMKWTTQFAKGMGPLWSQSSLTSFPTDFPHTWLCSKFREWPRANSTERLTTWAHGGIDLSNHGKSLLRGYLVGSLASNFLHFKLPSLFWKHTKSKAKITEDPCIKQSPTTSN